MLRMPLHKFKKSKTWGELIEAVDPSGNMGLMDSIQEVKHAFIHTVFGRRFCVLRLDAESGLDIVFIYGIKDAFGVTIRNVSFFNSVSNLRHLLDESGVFTGITQQN